MGYTKEEIKDMDKAAREIFGVPFNALDVEDQDYIYCYCEENVW